MITRFMDVDMSLLAGDIASVPSRLGDEERPQIGSLSEALSVPLKGKSDLDGKWIRRQRRTMLNCNITSSMVSRRFCTGSTGIPVRGCRSLLLPARQESVPQVSYLAGAASDAGRGGTSAARSRRGS
jgi:hypothetical protein